MERIILIISLIFNVISLIGAVYMSVQYFKQPKRVYIKYFNQYKLMYVEGITEFGYVLSEIDNRFKTKFYLNGEVYKKVPENGEIYIPISDLECDISN